MNLLSPIIILIEPQLGENIGSTSRAMLNFDVKNLRLVNPRDGWPNPNAKARAAGALEDKAFNVSVFKNLKEASTDISYLLATSSRHRDINKPVYNSSEAIFNIIKAETNNMRTGVVFGGEKSGLNNDDLVKADGIINIDCNKNFNSINLSMSVLTVCFQWFIEKEKISSIIKNSNNSNKNLATKFELNYFIDRLINILEVTKFFNPDEKKKVMITNIEAIFTRNNLTVQELKTLHGIITSITKD